jgi:hypothetical protein
MNVHQVNKGAVASKLYSLLELIEEFEFEFGCDISNQYDCFTDEQKESFKRMMLEKEKEWMIKTSEHKAFFYEFWRDIACGPETQYKLASNIFKSKDK